MPNDPIYLQLIDYIDILLGISYYFYPPLIGALLIRKYIVAR